MARWPAPVVGESGSAGQKRSWMPQELHHLRSHGHSWRAITEETGISKELHSGLFLACRKTYDLYAVCFAGLNRLNPRHLSESRVVYGQPRACRFSVPRLGFGAAGT